MPRVRPPVRWFHVLVVLPTLAGLACSGGREASGAQRQAERGGRIVPVAAAPVTRRDLSRAVTVTGAVEPVRLIGVNSLMAGTVMAVNAQEGDRVRVGQLLAELDAREPRAQLARARAVLASAEATYERNQQLHESRIITDAEFEQSRSAYEVAKSDAEVWRTRLELTRITAPSAGVVTVKHIEAGSAVSPNQRTFDIADLSLLVVRVRVSELDVVQLRAGAPVEVTLDAHPGARIGGRIRRVFPSADQQSRLVPVEVALGAVPGDVAVRPGFLARVRFALDRREGALAVPAPAVGMEAVGPRSETTAAGGTFVYVVEADTVVRRAVALGVTSEGWVEITSGLREAEVVVISGHTNLRPGTRVRVTHAEEPVAPADGGGLGGPG